MNEETKTLEDTFESMHSFWSDYIVKPDYDAIQFEKCYLQAMKTVKDSYEMIETYNI